MNLPYDNAKDAVEFWQKVADLFSLPIETTPDLRRTVTVDYTCLLSLEDFTRDMLARCVLWLDEMYCALVVGCDDGYCLQRDDGKVGPVMRIDCVIAAHRDAVLAVSGEGDKQ